MTLEEKTEGVREAFNAHWRTGRAMGLPDNVIAGRQWQISAQAAAVDSAGITPEVLLPATRLTCLVAAVRHPEWAAAWVTTLTSDPDVAHAADLSAEQLIESLPFLMNSSASYPAEAAS